MAPPLTHTLAGIDLHRGMVWIDEFDWSAMARATEYTITGALVIDLCARAAGRPITLAATESHGWIRRDVLQQLRALVDAAAGPLSLTLADGRTFSVVFAPDKPLEAQPVARAELPPDSFPYAATLSLLVA